MAGAATLLVLATGDATARRVGLDHRPECRPGRIGTPDPIQRLLRQIVAVERAGRIRCCSVVVVAYALPEGDSVADTVCAISKVASVQVQLVGSPRAACSAASGS